MNDNYLEIEKYINENCECFADGEQIKVLLTDAVKKDEGLLSELTYYMQNGDFLCKDNISGYTVVDIMIWQMDHFKAFLDRDTYGMRNNRSEMIMKAFATFAMMRQNPEKYLRMLTEESGSDYDGKIN